VAGHDELFERLAILAYRRWPKCTHDHGLGLDILNRDAERICHVAPSTDGRAGYRRRSTTVPSSIVRRA